MTGTIRPTTTLAARSTQDSNPQTSIATEALRRLKCSGYSALRDLTIDVHGEGLCLRGRVTTHYLKQVALAIVVQIEGVRRVLNLIEVADLKGRPRRKCSPAQPTERAGEGESSTQL